MNVTPIMAILAFTRTFWNDTRGVILPYTTLMLVVIVGVSVLALDGARLMGLQTQLQNGADALALAGAAELDRLPELDHARNQRHQQSGKQFHILWDRGK